jgi:hypothetical protein
MAGFLYCFPGDTPPTRESLRAAGFSLADLAEVPGRQCTNGPDKGAGWVFSLSSPPTIDGVQPLNAYKPDAQQWRAVYDDKLWLGWETANPPSQSDLQRKPEVSGRPVTMADGKRWLVPVLRDRLGTAGMRATLGPGSNGTVAQYAVVPEFAHLWHVVTAMWDMVRMKQADLQRAIDSGTVALTDRQLIDLAGEAFALNYRVTAWELGCLGLLTTDTLAATLAALVDIPEAALNAL